jgi:CheY-like chemotaxis protein
MNKILVVDDDSTMLRLISMALEINGHECLLASDGAEGLTTAREQNPDLILLDIMMPVMDGLRMLEELRKESDIPVIIISAYGNDERVNKARKLGIECFINKPFSFEALVDTVGMTLGDEGAGEL